MTEYIERAYIMGQITSSEMQAELKQMDGAGAYNRVLEIVNAAPAADAVPVVRCRECKWWLNSQLFPHSFYCLRTERVAYPDDFCSYGKLKEGAD